jgi:hypothetical protein
MRNTRSSAERLGRLIVGLVVALGVLVAMPLSAGHRMPWPPSLSIDRAEASVGSGPPFFSPTDLAVEASGSLVVVDGHVAAMLRVDPVSGDRTGVSHATIGNGPAFVSPTAVAVEASGALVVSDREQVLRVAPVSGDRTVVSR